MKHYLSLAIPSCKTVYRFAACAGVAGAVLAIALSTPLQAQSAGTTERGPEQDTAHLAPKGGCSTTTAAPCAASLTAAEKQEPFDFQFFTASSPTKEDIDSYMRTLWGYDGNREWHVGGILSTPVYGVERVVAFLGDKSGKTNPTPFMFFVLPDGKHVIFHDETTGVQLGGFGAHPFAEYRDLIQNRADGPFHGAPSKSLEIVEFADFTCPHCKAAQASMTRLAHDVPNAHIVFQPYLLSPQPASTLTAAYGLCIASLASDHAFFEYASYVFENQATLYQPDKLNALLATAVASSGLSLKQVSKCAESPDTRNKLTRSLRLGRDLGSVRLPTLVVNGRLVQGDIPYDTLLAIVKYQATLDEVH